MRLEDIADFIDIDLRFIKFAFHCRYFIAAFLKNAKESFFFLFIELFQFKYYIGQKFPNFPKVFTPDISKRRF